MEGPLAEVQITTETTWDRRLAATRKKATPALWLLGLSVHLIQVFVTLFLLHRLGLVSFPLLLLQLLLQPLLPAQLLQRQPLQVQVLLVLSLSHSFRPKDPQNQTRGPACTG